MAPIGLRAAVGSALWEVEKAAAREPIQVEREEEGERWRSADGRRIRQEAALRNT
jgi:hypothetical protein